jgi:DNA-binding transcriptional regulator YiaG
MKRQSGIDMHFKRSLKLKSGETVEIQSHNTPQPILYPCMYAGCSKKCLNAGALATHMKTHSTESSGHSSISSFFPKKVTGLALKTIVPFSFVMHAICSASYLTPVSLLRPIFRPTTPEINKEDGRKKNKGQEKRSSYTSLFKASTIELFEDQRLANPKLTQDEFAISQKISQSTLSQWMKEKETHFKRAADSQTRKLLKVRKTNVKHPEMEEELIRRFKA